MPASEDEDEEPTESERQFEEFLRKLEPYVPKLVERWFTLEREVRLEVLAHGQAGLAVLSFVALGSVSDSSKSMAKSSERIANLTNWLIGLSAVLTVETAVLIFLFFYR